MRKKVKNNQLDEKIRQYLNAHNMTVAELERKAGISRDVIRRFLGGHSKNLRVENMASLAKFMGLPMDEVAGDTEAALSVINIVPGAKQPRWHEADTDEMEPTFGPGSIVLVDHAVNNVGSAGIYLIKAGAGAAFRRISVSPITNKLMISADNKEKYAPDGEAAEKDIAVIGRALGIFVKF